MGKRRAEHSFEDNPFVDDFLEWMGSSEGEHSVDALDRVYAALENADVDARQRELRFWIRDPVNGIANVRGDVMLNMWDLFQRHGIELPHPQRDLTLRNPEALAGVLSKHRPAVSGRESFAVQPRTPK